MKELRVKVDSDTHLVQDPFEGALIHVENVYGFVVKDDGVISKVPLSHIRVIPKKKKESKK